MKIMFKRYFSKYSEIKPGEIFEHMHCQNSVYMKVFGTEEFTAVNLKTGELVNFDDDGHVHPVDFTLVENYGE